MCLYMSINIKKCDHDVMKLRAPQWYREMAITYCHPLAELITEAGGTHGNVVDDFCQHDSNSS